MAGLGGVGGTDKMAYSYDGKTWQNVVSNGTLFTDGSCNAVAWNGNTWVAGGIGEAALAYSSDGINWQGNTGVAGNILDSGGWRTAIDISANANADGFGQAVAFNASGTRLVVGAPNFSGNTGAVYIYDYSIGTDTWSSPVVKIGLQNGSKFGASVALSADGNHLVVGAPLFNNSNPNIGTIYDLSYNNGTWNTTPVLVSIPVGYTTQSNIGSSLAMNPAGTRLLAGAPGYSTSAGAVFDFSFNSVWNSNFTVVQNPNILVGSEISLTRFGTSVAYAANKGRCLVGEPNNGTGLVYSFDLSNNSGYWGLKSVNADYAIYDQSFAAVQTIIDASFGACVALDASGITAAVGAPGSGSGSGHVYMYSYSSGHDISNNSNTRGWAYRADISANAVGERFGSSVALNASGTRLVVGAANNASSIGKVYVYNYSPTTLTWNLENINGLTAGTLPLVAGDLTGTAVAMSSFGNRLVAGGPNNGTSVKGNAHIFDRRMQCQALNWNGSVWNAASGATATYQAPLAYSNDGLNWTNNSIITPTPPQLMKTYNGIDTSGNIGVAVAFNAAGTRMARFDMSGNVNSAFTVSVNIFDLSGNNWLDLPTQTLPNLGSAKFNILAIDVHIPFKNAYFGTPVAFNASGNILAVGINRGTANGLVKIYTYNAGTSQFVVTRDLSSNIPNDFFGCSVALNAAGTRLVIGAPYIDASYNQPGNVYVANFINGAWPANYAALTKIIPPTPATQFQAFGVTVALNAAGDILIVGAPGTGLSGSGGTGVFIYHIDSVTGSFNTTNVINYTVTTTPASGIYIAASIAINAIGDRIAVNQLGYGTDANGLTGNNNFYGYVFIVDFNYATNSWPLNAAINKVATQTYTSLNGLRDFFGYSLAFNAAGDRLLMSQLFPYIVGAGKSINNFSWGAINSVDFNYTTKTWPTNPTPIIKYLFNYSDAFYYGTLVCAINADGTVIAAGSNIDTNGWSANNYNGNMNIYNYQTKLALTAVKAIASNSLTTVAAGQGLTNIFATSSDGITWQNSAYDSAVMYAGGSGYIGVGDSAIKLPANSGLRAYPSAGPSYYGSALAMNANGTRLVVGSFQYSNGFKGDVWTYNYGNSTTNYAIPTNSNGAIVSGWVPDPYAPFLNENTFLNEVTSSFGLSVALNALGDIMVVGAPTYATTKGVVFTYNYAVGQGWVRGWVRTDASGTDASVLYGDSVISNFGWRVALNAAGNVLAVSSTNENTPQIGRVSLYNATNSGSWNLVQVINSTTGNTSFGMGLALNAAGTILAIGEPYFNTNAGRVFIYMYINGVNWLPMLATPYTATAGLYYGTSVALNAAGTRLVVGATNNNVASHTGSVYSYDYTNGAWPTSFNTYSAALTNTDVSGSRFGYCVALDASGGRLIVGENFTGTGLGNNVYCYNLTAGNWVQYGSTLTGNKITSSATRFGNALALTAAGDKLVVGEADWFGYELNLGRVNTFSELLLPRQCNALAANTNRWVAGGVSSVRNPLAYSNDGMTWLNSANGTAIFPFSGGICKAVAWSGSRWVAGGVGANPLAYSADGLTWFQSSNGASMFSGGACNAVAWNATLWLAAGTGTNTVGTNILAWSTDGISWNLISSSPITSQIALALSSRRVLPNVGQNALSIVNQAITNNNNTAVPGIVNQAITNNNNSNRIGMIGYDQTWQDMTASRAYGASLGVAPKYYNDTTRPIMVNAIFLSYNQFGMGVSDSKAIVYVNGINVADAFIENSHTGNVDFILYDYHKLTVSVIVPIGSYYQFVKIGNASTYMYVKELR